MVREFELPDVGEGLTEAEIVRWLVSVGDRVTEDQPVAEVETDKAVVEVPAPVNGTVREIRAEEGEMVPVGTVIVTFDVDGETAEETADDGREADAETGDAGTDPGPDPASDSDADAEPGSEADDGPPTDRRTFAAPSTRRLARELGVDLGAVAGSGAGGRITDGDVRAAAGAEGDATADDGSSETDGRETETGTETGSEEAPKPATRRIDDGEGFADAAGSEGHTAADDGGAVGPDPADRDRTLAAPATRRLADEAGIDVDSVPTDRREDGEALVTPAEIDAYAEAQKRAQAADAEAIAAETASPTPSESTAEESEGESEAESEGGERIPYRGIRRTIGERMERSKYTAPHVTHHDEADVTALVETRSRLRERAAERGSDLSYMPFVIKAVVAGLREYPILNSRLDEEREEIVLEDEYNVGVATATEAGLMVPVVEHADRKGLLEIADEMAELVAKARDRSIEREEMRGGTFSVTNFGAIGGEYATPIINYPETAILGTGSIAEKPRVLDGDVVARKVMTLSLSIDHRVIDGAEAARFTNAVIEYLENPELLLLE
ncbi:dihydrolipoamide acetyltransferase family protein [Natronomonas sp.]|uniref:dihydrolipoamide acetyltransferase family protein n=1 Tax=Natronomonas sp. TaxID=2184060 RepID=UPI002628A3A8|nr:dihydrolipoamide acetyltransferase family protein [Natronomonas sp.]